MQDPEQTTVSSLTRTQFHDHIPQVLDAYQERLRADGRERRELAAAQHTKEEEIKHGLQRWQQGYRLRELMREWGSLHVVLYEALQQFSFEQPSFPPEDLSTAQRALIQLVNDGISESAAQYARMQQAEAAGQAADLQHAIAELRASERRRAELIRHVVHDLRGNVQSVSTTAEALSSNETIADDRNELAGLLQKGVDGVSVLLKELMDLARIEAGQEVVNWANFDAGRMLNDFCRVTRPMAEAAGLYLRNDGPAELTVMGDEHKTRRILQNLVHNALKYTKAGGVTLTWGEEGQQWWLKIKDTGPGILGGPVAPIAVGLDQATKSAKEAFDRVGNDAPGELPPLPAAASADMHVAALQSTGEGIGLSIVKRLCEVLDASIEMTSSADDGTTFRVVFPRLAAVPVSKPAGQ